MTTCARSQSPPPSPPPPRVKMSRMNPTRNIVAEAARDQLPRVCENADCRQMLTYRTVRVLQDREGSRRSVWY
jgi:hypothetical protein